jgi:hypothetical protein
VVFHHLTGISLAPTVNALANRKVFDIFQERPGAWIGFDDLVERTRANRGYLHVGLRLLVGAGWLQHRTEGGHISYQITDLGLAALSFALPLYAEVTSYIPKAIFFEDFLYGKSDEPILPSLRELTEKAKGSWGIVPSEDPVRGKLNEQIRQHLDGMLIGPAMVALARSGALAKMEKGPTETSAVAPNSASLSCILDLMNTLGWVTREGHTVKLTSCGVYAGQIAASYGVTVSYLPLFDNLSTLMFGNPRIPRFDENDIEVLVNRGMNVWGSGGAHKTYFKKVDEIIAEIFSGPIESQPKGICDMGCGDGVLLAHLYEVVKTRTPRGQMLDKYPLMVVGADFNKVARRITKQNLRKWKVPNVVVIHGDINRPAQLAGDLETLGHDIHDLLHVRSFLDHNRPYLPPANYVPGTRVGKSTGAFAHMGEDIPADVLEENLVRHLKRWAPFVSKYGLLLLELHTIPPELTAANQGKSPAVAYDATHGFSDQYLVEVPIFLDLAKEAGLQADPRFQSKFPPSDLATVTINYFTGASAS